MTIHKSKGLEFDTVILPGLHRKGPSDDHELMLWEEVALEGLDEQLVAAPFSQRGRSGWPTPYEYLRLLERERSTNEKTRVLYVAVTRAIRRLYLVGVARRNAEGDPVASAGSFLDLLWGSVAGDFTAVAECASLPVTVAASPCSPMRQIPSRSRRSVPIRRGPRPRQSMPDLERVVTASS